MSSLSVLKAGTFGSNKRKTAQRSLQHYTDLKTAYRFQPDNFNFQAFPPEIAAQILVLATTTSGYWKTYKSLVIVSRAMKALVYSACLPYLPVMLHTKKHVDSFRLLLESYPSAVVGHHIRSLWFIAGIKAGVERTDGLYILKTCTGITHLACRINPLMALVGESESLVHHQLRHLTLVETIVPWQQLLIQPAAPQLFMQLTHLRVSGGTEFVKPDSSFCFASLSRLSFTCHDLSTCLTPKSTSHSTPASPFPSAQFPVLQQIVPSIPYMNWRERDPKTLHKEGLAIDGRMDALTCPKKWKEADMWESARRGGNDLWTRARAGEYLQKSRAFTSEPRTSTRTNDNLYYTSRDFDDFGWDSDEYGPFGGETGL